MNVTGTEVEGTASAKVIMSCKLHHYLLRKKAINRRGCSILFYWPGTSVQRVVYGLVKKGLVLLAYLIPQKQEKLLVSAV